MATPVPAATSAARGLGALTIGRTSTASTGRGFTLVEVLLVLVLLGVVGSAALSLFLRNARFYDRNTETIDARQNVRSAIDLFAAELRPASSFDFLAAEPDSLALRFDVSRSVVCDSTAVDDLALVAFDSVRGANVPSTFRGTAISEPYAIGFTYLDGWSAQPSEKGAGPRSVCEARGATLNLPVRRFRRAGGWRQRYGSLPKRGSLVRVYGRLSYRFARASFGGGFALRRNGQEVAAPFAEGAAFSYLLRGGGEVDGVPSSDFGRIRAVRVRLAALGRSGATRLRTPVRLPAEHLVFLRN